MIKCNVLLSLAGYQIHCNCSMKTQGVCLTVARSPVASVYCLGLVERPSPLARRASDHDIQFLQ